MEIDVNALIFLILGIVGLIFGIIAFFLSLHSDGNLKKFVIPTSILSFGFFIATMACAADALNKYYVFYQGGKIQSIYVAPTSNIAIGLGITTIAIGVFSFVGSIICRIKFNKLSPTKAFSATKKDDFNIGNYEEELEQIKEASNLIEENKSSAIAENATIANELKALNTRIEAIINNGKEVSDSNTNETILLSASTNIGIGLWTSICVSISSIFGVQSKNYKNKMNIILSEIKNNLELQMSRYKEYEFKDFRIVKEKGLAYYGTVIGTKKK